MRAKDYGRNSSQRNTALTSGILLSLEGLRTDQTLGKRYYGEFLSGSPEARAVPTLVAAHAHLVVDRLRLPVSPLEPEAFKRSKSHTEAVPDGGTALIPPTSPTPPAKKARVTAILTDVSEEDQLIMEARNLGQSWTEIAAALPGRSATALRKYYNAKLRPKAKESTPAPRIPSQAHASLLGVQPTDVQPTGNDKARTARLSSLESPIARLAPVDPATGRASYVEVSHRATEVAGGDARVQLSAELPEPPPNTTVLQAHGLQSMNGVRFYQEVGVVDSDDTSRIYAFSLDRPEHGACFNIGLGPDGTALISYSDLFALYELPDGTKWAEHGALYDMEDMEDHCCKAGKRVSDILPTAFGAQELVRKVGRYHSRLQNIEYEFWVYRERIPMCLPADAPVDNTYFWRIAFDPQTLRLV